VVCGGVAAARRFHSSEARLLLVAARVPVRALRESERTSPARARFYSYFIHPWREGVLLEWSARYFSSPAAVHASRVHAVTSSHVLHPFECRRAAPLESHPGGNGVHCANGGEERRGCQTLACAAGPEGSSRQLCPYHYLPRLNVRSKKNPTILIT